MSTLALIFSLVGAANAQANTYFVSVYGTDGSAGTADSPWGTLRFAVSQLRAGDTLYLRGGTYTGGANVIDSQSAAVPSGTSWSNAITIAGYPNEAVTIQPPDGSEGIKLTNGTPSYLIFQDFSIDMSNQSFGTGAGPTGIYVGNGAHHNRFLRLEVKNNQGNGISFSSTNGNSPFNEIIGCSIHDNGRYPGVNTGYGLYIFTSDNLIEGNDVYSNSGYGMVFYNYGGAPNVARNLIRNNRIHDNGTHGGPNYGIVVAWGSDNVVANNTIYGNRGGIQIYTNSSNTGVYGNEVFNNWPAEGISLQYYASAPTVRYNNVYSNGRGIVDYGGGAAVVDSNNVPGSVAY